LPVSKPTNYRTEKIDYHLALHFVLPLKEPVPIKGNTFSLSIYDATYYVEMLHLDRHRGRQLAAPLPHHLACGSAPGGSRS
jgi:ABC-type uncharacterized transport system substrate-binding protein